MRLSKSTKAAASLTALWVSACTHVPVAAPTAPARLLTTDGLPSLDNRAELLAHAERLCVSVASPTQRQLGYRTAVRAASLAPLDPGLAMLVARCAFLSADLEADETSLIALSDAGLAAIKVADPTGKNPACAYYHALLLGLAVRHKGIDALSRVPEVIAALEVAQERDDLDLGGPLRTLGMLYLKAPPWPTGPGDLEAALETLKTAVERYPSHPLNHLFFAEALAENNQKPAATQELNTARALGRADLWGETDANRWQKAIANLEAKLSN